MAHAKAHDHPMFQYGGDVPEALDVIRKERSHALILALVAILVALFATIGIMYVLLAPTHLVLQ